LVLWCSIRYALQKLSYYAFFFLILILSCHIHPLIHASPVASYCRALLGTIHYYSRGPFGGISVILLRLCTSSVAWASPSSFQGQIDALCNFNPGFSNSAC
jgi:hypothetical protein